MTNPVREPPVDATKALSSKSVKSTEKPSLGRNLHKLSKEAVAEPSIITPPASLVHIDDNLAMMLFQPYVCLKISPNAILDGHFTPDSEEEEEIKIEKVEGAFFLCFDSESDHEEATEKKNPGVLLNITPKIPTL
ncbi:hypothetical protein L6452_19214 [Arctium lappa]|uniref:Uncharacterized protein n=1 Tax=Arctium lappa TaxID=4217 RepID=A0ACB9B8H9_ARCLA|nr:hypothetical protein L6452_19214 [Arctium lappa]